MRVGTAVWDYVDAGVAYVFGLDESKYQWAVDRHNQQVAQVSHQHCLLSPHA
jgi:hypothetical protein